MEVIEVVGIGLAVCFAAMRMVNRYPLPRTPFQYVLLLVGFLAMVALSIAAK
jgi:hypothetical protein